MKEKKTIEQCKDQLMKLNEMRFYQKYINRHLAGDFSCNIVEHIDKLEKEIKEAKQRTRDIIYSITEKAVYRDDDNVYLLGISKPLMDEFKDELKG